MLRVPDEDIDLFARGMIGRYGNVAFRLAEQRAKQLSEMGDHEGVDAWSRVAAAVRGLGGASVENDIKEVAVA